MWTVAVLSAQFPTAVKETGRPDDAEAVRAKSESPKVLAGSGANVIVCDVEANVAVTALSCVADRMHAPLPVQSPCQPTKADPASAVAVSITGVPSAKEALHVAPQAIPARPLETDPLPFPLFVTATPYRTSGPHAGSVP